MQAGASGTRMEYLVGTTESVYLEPMLQGLHWLNRKFLDPLQALEILGPEGKTLQLNPTQIKNAECRFKFLASERMQSRTATLQALPLLSQSLLNPAFLGALAQTNQMKVNMAFIGNRIADAMNWRAQDVFMPLSQQDLARMNAPPPGDQLKDRMQDKRLLAHHQGIQEKVSGDILKELLMHSSEMASEEDGEKEEEPPVQ